MMMAQGMPEKEELITRNTVNLDSNIW
jgi:hypothetical protein